MVTISRVTTSNLDRGYTSPISHLNIAASLVRSPSILFVRKLHLIAQRIMTNGLTSHKSQNDTYMSLSKTNCAELCQERPREAGLNEALYIRDALVTRSSHSHCYRSWADVETNIMDLHFNLSFVRVLEINRHAIAIQLNRKLWSQMTAKRRNRSQRPRHFSPFWMRVWHTGPKSGLIKQ